MEAVPRLANLVISERGTSSLSILAEEFESRRVRPHAASNRPLAFICLTGLDCVAGCACLARSRRDGLLLPIERLTEPVRRGLLRAGFALAGEAGPLEEDASAEAVMQPGRVSLLTSGTTGVPKIIAHSWESLFTTGRSESMPPLRWLMTYQGGTYAWYQILTILLFHPNQELVLSDGTDPSAMIETARREQVTAISSTPTFWRVVLLLTPPERLAALNLRQITLGGEPVDQIILDQIRRVQPRARITHIYASTEAGAAIVVHDGREGFPQSWLGSERLPSDPQRPQLRVENDVLFVRSPHASIDHQAWIDTGDAVEIRDGRVVITGRRDSAIVNVGGTKVAVYDVECALRTHAQVVWCRVYGRPAPLVGSLIAADVVLRAPSRDHPAMEAELDRFLRSRLPEAGVPRFWRIMETIPATRSFKTELA